METIRRNEHFKPGGSFVKKDIYLAEAHVIIKKKNHV